MSNLKFRKLEAGWYQERNLPEVFVYRLDDEGDWGFRVGRGEGAHKVRGCGSKRQAVRMLESYLQRGY